MKKSENIEIEDIENEEEEEELDIDDNEELIENLNNFKETIESHKAKEVLTEELLITMLTENMSMIEAIVENTNLAKENFTVLTENLNKFQEIISSIKEIFEKNANFQEFNKNVASLITTIDNQKDNLEKMITLYHKKFSEVEQKIEEIEILFKKGQNFKKPEQSAVENKSNSKNTNLMFTVLSVVIAVIFCIIVFRILV